MSITFYFRRTFSICVFVLVIGSFLALNIYLINSLGTECILRSASLGNDSSLNISAKTQLKGISIAWNPQTDKLSVPMGIERKENVSTQITITGNISNVSTESPKDEPSNWLERTKWTSKVDHHLYNYLINPTFMCEGSTGQFNSADRLMLLILVKSAPGNSELRDAIRSTYIQGAMKYNLSCKTFFLLGFPDDDEKTQALIVKEAGTHGDIIQEDFVDSYYNLTKKIIMGFKWASTFCSDSQFVMLIDDDVMVDVLTLVDDLSKTTQESRSGFVLGEVTYNAAPFRNRKGLFGKFYTPKSLYTADRYPTYPQGYAYIVSQDVAPQIHRASLVVPPPVPWEDVYFGTLLQRTGIRITDRKPWFRKRHPFNVTASHPLVQRHDYFKIELSVHSMTKVWGEFDNEVILRVI